MRPCLLMLVPMICGVIVSHFPGRTEAVFIDPNQLGQVRGGTGGEECTLTYEDFDCIDSQGSCPSGIVVPPDTATCVADCATPCSINDGYVITEPGDVISAASVPVDCGYVTVGATCTLKHWGAATFCACEDGIELSDHCTTGVKPALGDFCL